MPDEADSDVTSAAHDRAREGLDHLQAAARELVAAARAALDVAEDLIDDPDTMASVVGATGGLGDLLRHLLPARRPATSADADPGSADALEGDTPSTVQRITVA